MGLLTEDEHDRLIDLLCKMPHSTDQAMRRQLMTGLPQSLQVQVLDHGVPKMHFTSMVDLADEYSTERYEGVWPIVQLIRRAIFHVGTRSPIGTRLEELVAGIQIRANRWELWSSRFAGLPPQDSEHLEHIIDSTMGMLDPVDWRNRMHQGERATCLILFQGYSPEPQGTGFLVGPDVLITNYHVMEIVLRQHIDPKDVILCFDFKTYQNTPVSTPRPYRLSSNYLIDSSLTNDLDYTLLRMNGIPGADAADGAAERGWLTPKKHLFQTGEPLFIIQHPQGGPLKFAFDRVKIADERRVYYRTNTDEGSSGSPCFTFTWELVALHQGVNLLTNDSEQMNKGIPFSSILKRPKVQAALQL